MVFTLAKVVTKAYHYTFAQTEKLWKRNLPKGNFCFPLQRRSTSNYLDLIEQLHPMEN